MDNEMKMIKDCLAAKAKLSTWEWGFMESLKAWKGPLTERQRAKLIYIWERTRG
jgi:hypothetical protein